MQEEYKVKIPIITDEELLSINTHWQEMVDELSKVQVQQKDLLTLKLIIERQDKEIKRLQETSINGVLRNDYDLLCKDYKKQQQRIDKAIKYVEKEYNKYNKVYDSFQWWLENLLKILKGSNK